MESENANPPAAYYVVCWTAEEGIYSCGHQHRTIEQAVACLIPDGRSFVRCREGDKLRSLSDSETLEFFKAAAARLRPKLV